MSASEKDHTGTKDPGYVCKKLLFDLGFFLLSKMEEDSFRHRKEKSTNKKIKPITHQSMYGGN